MPLAANMGLDSNSGLFTFVPAANQVGTYQLTFTVTDGQYSDSETITITAPAPTAGGLTQVSNKLLDATDLATGTETPIAGVTVSIVGQNVSTTTAADGSFTLTSAGAGPLVLSFDAENITGAYGGAYASADFPINLIDGVTNQQHDPFVLARLDLANHCVTLQAGQPLAFTQADIGVSITAPADSVHDATGNPYGGQICLSTVPVAQITQILPPSTLPCSVVAVQGMDALFSAGAAMTFPNGDNLPANALVDIWHLMGGGDQWIKVGDGIVSTDASSISTVSDSILGGGYVFAVPKPPAIALSADNAGDSYSPTALNDGNVKTVISSPGYTSMGASRNTNLVYNSATADPNPIVAADITLLANLVRPSLISSQLVVGGITVTDEVYTSLTTPADTNDAGLDPGSDQVIRQALTFPASTMSTGSYPYTITTTANFDCSKVAVDAGGNLLINNESDSVFGSGWSMPGLQRVIEMPDGSLVLSDGSGALQRFQEIKPWFYFNDFETGAPGSVWSNQKVSLTRVGARRYLGYFFENEIKSTFAEIPVHTKLQVSFDLYLFDSWDGSQAGFHGPDIFSFGIDGETPLTNSTFSFFSYLQAWPDNYPGASYPANTGAAEINTLGWHFGPWRRSAVYKITHTIDHTDADLLLRFAATSRGHNDDFWGIDNFYIAVVAGQNGEVLYAPPPGDFSDLKKNPDGTYTRTTRDGTVFQFNTSGLMVSMTLPNGQVTTYTYDAQERLISIDDPGGLSMSYVYGANGKLASTTEPVNRTQQYQYDADGNLTGVISADLTSQLFAYAAGGAMTSQTDANGNVTTYNYSADGLFTGMDNPDGSAITANIYRSLGLPTGTAGTATEPLPYARPGGLNSTIYDANGNPLHYSFDSFGNVIKFTDAVGRVTEYERNDAGLVTKLTKTNDGELPDGSTPGTVVTELDYDGQGNIIARRQAVGTTLERQILFEYEPVHNRLTKLTDAAGNVTIWTYDANGNPTKITDAAGKERSAIYDQFGLMTSMTDEKSNVTTYVHNAFGQVLTRTDPDGTVSRFLRNGAGKTTSIIFAEGTVKETTTLFAYDELNRVTSITDPLGKTTAYGYDDNGNVTSITDRDGVTATAAYDSRNRLTSRSDPAFGTVAWVYDNNNNPIRFTDAKALVTTYAFDTVNRLITLTDANAQSQSVTYDASDNAKTFTNAKNGVTTFTRDLLDRVIKRINPMAEQFVYGYDSRDNLTGLTDPKGQVFAYGYDVLSRLTQITKPDGTVTYGYDDYDNLTALNDNASALVFTYDNVHRLASAATLAAGTQPAVTLTNGFDRRDNRITLADSLGGNWAYALDLNDRMTGLTLPTGAAVALTYRAGGQMATISYPNTTSAAFQYGATTSLLTGLDHRLGATNFVADVMSHDASGTLTGVTGLSRNRTYSYDDLYRLTAVSDSGAAANENYTYDADGNRMSSHLSAAHTLDGADRLLQDNTHDYTYDANGNLTSKTITATGAVTTYTWDSLDRLTAIALPGGGTSSYTYDAFGRRISKTVNGTVTKYLYDGLDIIAEFDGAGTLTARYSHGPSVDQPLVMTRYDSGGTATSYYLHADQLGSITHVTDASGAVVNQYTYDGYGNRLSASETVPQPYGFTGREYDGESGLYYYRARYYDPNSGRFISSDPVGFAGGDSNLYAYVFNDPANMIDPSGLSATESGGTRTIGASATGGISATGITTACLFYSVASGLSDILGTTALLDANVQLAKAFADLVLWCDPTRILKGIGKFGKIAKLGQRRGGGSKGGGKGAPKGGPKGGGCSFDGSTLVHGVDGYLQIKDVKAGDRVWAKDDKTGQESLQLVTNVYGHLHEDNLTLSFAANSGSKITETVKTTSEHPFFVRGQGWVAAGKLEAGMRIITAGDQSLTLVAIKQNPAKSLTYNITVENDHTFFVGAGQLWVHNACKKPHGNSKDSTKGQHGYEIVDRKTGKPCKTGVSGCRLNKDGSSPRANAQANKWNKQPGNGGRYKPKVVKKIPEGPGARKQILEWEKKNANRNRKWLDPLKHKRP